VAVRIDRRRFCLTVAAALATAGGCSTVPDEAPRPGLVRLLGLTSAEEAWLDVLSPEEQRELHQALRAPGETSRRTVDLVLKVLGRRERLFAYVGYPELPPVGICDGLIRE
jgi:hypothetical protein